jgi:DNA invertase Pin-like site-specific DNA recombinase
MLEPFTRGRGHSQLRAIEVKNARKAGCSLPGDSIVVESFSRLGRSMKDLIELVEYFESKNAKLISIK